MNQPKKNSLLVGLIAIIAVIVVVSLIGVFAFRPEPLILQGEAEATEYRVSVKVPGRIELFRAEEGDMVKKGDTLAIVDSPEIRAKLAQANAAKRAAEAQNRKAINGARQEQKDAAYEMWQKAEAGVTIYEKTYNRVKNLYAKEVVSAQKLDEAEAQYKAAVATANAAKTQYDMACKGAQTEDKEAARALVAQAEGAVSEVESYLDEIYLIAPSDGEVSETFPKVGELIGTGSPVMTITDLEQMYFTFDVREDLLSGLTKGSEVTVKIPALDNRECKVKVTFMRPMAFYATWRATKASGQFDAKTFELKMRPEEKIEGLRPGMTAIIVTKDLK